MGRATPAMANMNALGRGCVRGFSDVSENVGVDEDARVEYM